MWGSMTTMWGSLRLAPNMGLYAVDIIAPSPINIYDYARVQAVHRDRVKGIGSRYKALIVTILG